MRPLRQEMCILLNDAWDLLSDEDKRKDYDAQIQLLFCFRGTRLAPSHITLPGQVICRIVPCSPGLHSDVVFNLDKLEEVPEAGSRPKMPRQGGGVTGNRSYFPLSPMLDFRGCRLGSSEACQFCSTYYEYEYETSPDSTSK